MIESDYRFSFLFNTPGMTIIPIPTSETALITERMGDIPSCSVSGSMLDVCSTGFGSTDEMVAVPTLTEAKDIIELENIERDLGI